MGKRHKADDPSDIIAGKHKRTISDRAKAVVNKVKNVVRRKSSKKDADNTMDMSSVSSDAPLTSIRPAKKAHKVTVQSEEEDNEALASQGVTDIVEVTVDGHVRSSHSLSRQPSQASAHSSTSSTPSGPELEEVSQEELDQKQLEQMKKGWNTAVYAFYDPDPAIKYNSDGRKCHIFRCTGRGCTQLIKRHFKKCWGEDILSAAEDAKDPKVWTKVLRDYRLNGSITTAFERKGKGKVTYSHQTHMRTETRVEIVRWVSESNHPFAIVKDRGFQSLMKTGQPNHYILHPTTVSRDIKKVFARSRRWIAKMLQEYDRALNYATNTWTSPNH
ncbi:uncharacterized protein LACBIDRAFT_311470 [Laccaria bicolor S238N-H82]|uniref:Predicted protein n=1 Tax=Laccaria bicolor (strain S238N-H82 / ATCC MYA-4686) TaxID=486041 RepID=B0CXG2_LACBS|nr:uncharacterized protein LACBIDRAFT_311470 [Laccaria bicolor S238N-H82]EDR12718.1 predicted protein [Laccaria bicolor S238N-H82]|eukprot:XP_001876982.1 predicted protein [Laccaria bicolor S238N-H82]